MPLQISKETRALARQAEDDLREQFDRVDQVAQANAEKVLDAFQTHRVSESYFAGTTGYGYDDLGRDKLEEIYAQIFHTEDALVRIQFINGTHAITCALFGALKPGETLLYAVGAPYDTIQSAIGIVGNAPGSLKSYGIGYRQVELTADEKPDLAAIARTVGEDPTIKAVMIQRSRGYATRASLSVAEIGAICDAVHGVRRDLAILVDNCYGEFVETLEPTQVGADLVVGSLIKNPGGGLAPTGGYVCGRADLIDRCARRLSAPGLGREVGANLGLLTQLYQGFFLSPTVTAAAVKGAVFAAACYEKLGFRVVPAAAETRHDIIQAVELGSREGMVAFCKGIQAAAPVDSYVTPEPWAMPGYDSEVIMAAGAFVQGSSIELSADGPIRPPYAVYFQGGLTWYHAKLGILMSLQKMLEAGLISL